MDPKHIKEMQTHMRKLSQELDASRGTGGFDREPGDFNVQVMKPARSSQEINAELMALMKKMSKEQLLPMCIRCGIFWGIFALLGAIYGAAGNVLSFDFLFFGRQWIGAYVMFSLIFSFGFLGLQKLYQKLTHQEKPAMTETLLTTIPTRVSWKDRLEAAKREFQGKDKSEKPFPP